MKTLDTQNQILLKTLDIELKKILQQELAAYHVAQLRSKGNKQAA